MNIITEAGYQLVKKKLSDLEKEKKEIADRLSYARLDGDLSENAAWIALRESLEKVQDNITRIRNSLEEYEVISFDHKQSYKSIQIGNKVTYEAVSKSSFEDQQKKMEIEITSEIDSDPFVGKISYQSPLGSSLLGKEVGDIVDVVIPKSSNNYKIKVLEIK